MTTLGRILIVEDDPNDVELNRRAQGAIVSSFLPEAMLVAVKAVAVSRQPFSDPGRHHVALWHISEVPTAANEGRLRFQSGLCRGPSDWQLLAISDMLPRRVKVCH